MKLYRVRHKGDVGRTWNLWTWVVPSRAIQHNVHPYSAQKYIRKNFFSAFAVHNGGLKCQQHHVFQNTFWWPSWLYDSPDQSRWTNGRVSKILSACCQSSRCRSSRAHYIWSVFRSLLEIFVYVSQTVSTRDFICSHACEFKREIKTEWPGFARNTFLTIPPPFWWHQKKKKRKRKTEPSRAQCLERGSPNGGKHAQHERICRFVKLSLHKVREPFYGLIAHVVHATLLPTCLQNSIRHLNYYTSMSSVWYVREWPSFRV